MKNILLLGLSFFFITSLNLLNASEDKINVINAPIDEMESSEDRFQYDQFNEDEEPYNSELQREEIDEMEMEKYDEMDEKEKRKNNEAVEKKTRWWQFWK
jgi:hypothetical protein